MLDSDDYAATTTADIAFTVTLCVSWLLSLLTTAIASVHVPASPQRTHTISNRMIRIAGIVSAIVAFLILFPLAAYGYREEAFNESAVVCWTQALALQWSFMALHVMAVMAAVHTYLLVVKVDANAEDRLENVYWGLWVAVPTLIVGATVAVNFSGLVEPSAPSIMASPGYCIWSQHWLNFIGYTLPYMVTTVIGTAFSVRIVISLYHARRIQSDLIMFHEQSPKVSSAILWKSIMFTVFYCAMGLMSFMPSLLQFVAGERPELTLLEAFLPSLIGWTLFLLFGTGEQGQHVLARVRSMFKA